MKVQNFKTTSVNGRKRVSAEVLWETADRPREEIYYEVDQQFADDISCNPDAFFLATVFPALYYGEQCYTIDREICPLLYQGVKDVLGFYYQWYYTDKRAPITLEIETRSQVVEQKGSKNAAFFLSGGIDSYATFVDNRLTYKKEHPLSIKDGVVAFGLEQDDPEKFEYVLSMLNAVANRFEVNLIPVYTNIYLKYREEDALNDFYFWIWEYQGAALASIAHILGKRLSNISIASSFDIQNVKPYGSHPLVEPNFSSNNMKVRHDGIIYSRLEKIKMVTDYLSLPFNLRVCNYFNRYEPGKLNCGKCEKCIRTMLGFLALGELNNTDAFPFNDVTRQMVMKHVDIKLPYVAACYQELIAPLKKINRDDLITVIEYKLKKYHKSNSKIRNNLRKIDKKVFNNSFNKINNEYKKYNKKSIFLRNTISKIDKKIFNNNIKKSYTKLTSMFNK